MDLNWIISLALRLGIALSILVLLLGLAAKAFTTEPWPRTPTPLHVLPWDVFQLHLAGIFSLGVLVMILTPVARVVLSLGAFARDRDRLYVLLTGIVLLNLLVGILIAVA